MRAMTLVALSSCLLVGSSASAQTGGVHLDMASLGLAKGAFTSFCLPANPLGGGFVSVGGFADCGPYTDFDLDGNPYTIEIVEIRPSMTGMSELDLRVSRVVSTAPVRLCVGEWFTPITLISERLAAAGSADWAARWRIANLGGRDVLWYRTPTAIGSIDFTLPMCG